MTARPPIAAGISDNAAVISDNTAGNGNNAMKPWWKSVESNTEIADQIYTQFIHINIGAQILYNLLCRFIHLPIAAPIHSNTNSRGTNYSRKTTNDCDPLIPLYLPELQT